MILIVFSDIHGNIYALEKALKLMENYKADEYLFLGDMAGYYYNQNECISLLSKIPNLITIKGNHDHNFLHAINNAKELSTLDKKYGNSYTLLNDTITNTSKDFFYSMKEYEKNNIYEAYHGSPNNLYFNEYIYPDNDLLSLRKVNTPFLFLGHTHYNMIKNLALTKIINPGSIGQPRDYNKPSFVIIDTDNLNVEMVRFDYDKTNLILDIQKNDINNEYLSKILKRKKND